MEIRSKENVKNHGEVFTPLHIVDEMLELFPQEVWEDPSYIFLEPTCGNGNFLKKIAVKRFRSGIPIIECFNTVIGMDISKENIRDSRIYLARVAGWMLSKTSIKVDTKEWAIHVQSIMAILVNNVFRVDDSLKIIKDYPQGLLEEKKFVLYDPTGNNQILPEEESKHLIKRCEKVYRNKNHFITKEFYHYVGS